MLAFAVGCWQCLSVPQASKDPRRAGLTDEERAVVDFERNWWVSPTQRTKQESIRTALGLSPTRYYAVLETLVERREALEYDPLLMRRLRRRRDQRRRALFAAGDQRRR